MVRMRTTEAAREPAVDKIAFAEGIILLLYSDRLLGSFRSGYCSSKEGRFKWLM